MTSHTALVRPIADQYQDPSIFNRFFNPEDRDQIEDIYSSREALCIGKPGRSCELNIFIGFFFDGTRNNYAESESKGYENYSNVARLFDAYPGQTIAPQVMLNSKGRWPDESKYPNYFRLYVPGVGTAFKECGDTGAGADYKLGSAGALWSERRLVWALVQAINAVHRYFFRSPLIGSDEALVIARAVSLDRRGLGDSPRFMRLDDSPDPIPANAKAHFENVLTRLHVALKPHMPDPGTGQPAKVDPGIIKTIYASAFGFSRGATAARAFANWLVALCQLDARMLRRPGSTLGGFPVCFDFLGLFDTVASVGLASSTLIRHGHGGYADAEVSLRVPPGIACTHLVAAHEMRRSFPLDSISVGGQLADGCQEIVFPGVHSDVGGGYAPGEQGRGLSDDGRDLPSRIPLAVMYREARLNGVPFKLELGPPLARERFMISPTIIRAFNAYIHASEAYARAHPRFDPARPLRAIMRTQMEIAMLWRKGVAERLDELDSTRRAAQVDRSDLTNSNEEFVTEMKRFKDWEAGRRSTVLCSNRVVTTCMRGEAARVPGLDSERFEEWVDIASFWHNTAALAPALTSYLEEFIHDSRAWFKLTGWEAGLVEGYLREWVKLYEAERAMNGYAPDGSPVHSRFTLEEEAWILEYREKGKVPAMKTHGREPFELGAGYLRFRRVYAGGDELRITRLPHSTTHSVKAGVIPAPDLSAA